MTINYDERDVIVSKNKNSLVTEVTDVDEKIDLDSFYDEKRKGVNIVANSTYTAGLNYIRTSSFDDSIKALNGRYRIVLANNGNKKVQTGQYADYIEIWNTGKNIINVGNGQNVINSFNCYATNTITSGIDNDVYYLYKGINNIIDKGGNNTINIETGGFSLFPTNTIKLGNGDDTVNIKDSSINNISISGGNNTITSIAGNTTIKTGAGNDTFSFIMGDSDKNSIDSGKGDDSIEVSDEGIDSTSKHSVCNIKSGDGDDTVKIKHSSGRTLNTIITNIDLGKGDDSIILDAGFSNLVKAGAGKDSIVIAGGVNTVYTGKGDDKVHIGNYSTNDINTGDGNDSITVDADSYNTIHAGNGNDSIIVRDGGCTIYSDKGKDTIEVYGGISTYFCQDDEISFDNCVDNYNYIHALGNTKIKLDTESPTIQNVFFDKKNNYLELNNKATAYMYINAGKNTIVISGDAENNSTLDGDNKDKKTTTNLTVKGGARIYGYLGTGNDRISLLDTSNTYSGGLSAGKGNDTFDVNGGVHNLYGDEGNDIFNIVGKSKNIQGQFFGDDGKDTFNVDGFLADYTSFYGGAGKDVFNIISGDKGVFYGDDGNDIFNLTAGDANKLYGDDGNDTFNLTVGDANTLYGDDGNDIFNLTGGNGNVVHGGVGNDIFNISGGTKIVEIFGDESDDVYNITSCSKVYLKDFSGSNTINIKKGYSGLTLISSDESTTNKLVLDKSFKLTNSKNISSSGEVKTNSANMTVYINYTKSTREFDSVLELVKDFKEEISDGLIDDNLIAFSESYIDKFVVGGKNYKLDLSELEQNIVGWMNGHSYATTDDVFKNGNQEDINSLMSIYVAGTQDCFVK